MKLKDFLNEGRMMTRTFDISRELEKIPGVEQRVGMWAIVDGTTTLIRYKDGNAYEITVKPAKYADHKDVWGKLIDPEGWSLKK